MMDLHGLVDHIRDDHSDDVIPHIVIPLLGRFNNEVGEIFNAFGECNKVRLSSQEVGRTFR